MTDRSIALIATPLAGKLVDRIREDVPEVQVIHREDLLPVARYPADHDGDPRTLTAEQRREWDRLLASAEIMLGLDFLHPATLRARSPRLVWIQGTSAGMAGYLGATDLAGSGVMVTTAAGLHGTPLAEFAAMACLYFFKGVPRLETWRGTSHWERHVVRELHGTRAAVIGLGHVGRAVARTLAGLGMEVWAARRGSSERRPRGVRSLFDSDRLLEVLPEIDVLVLAAPETAETVDLVGLPELEAMKRDAVVVNIGRGSILDEEALASCIRGGRLSGAALDVFRSEPLPTSSPLWSLPNVLVSPHSAATVPEENARLVDLFIGNLHRYFAGRRLRNVYRWQRNY